MRLGAAIVCVGGTLCALLDAMWQVANGAFGAQSATFAIGVGAPFVLAASLLGGLTALAWARSVELRELVTKVRDRATDGARREPDRAVAAGCAALVTFGLAGGLLLGMIASIVVGIRTPSFAAAAALIATSVVAVGAVVLFPLAYVPLRAGLQRLAQASWGSRLVRPRPALLLGAGLCVAGGLAVALRFESTLALLPWNLAVAVVLAGLVSALLVARAPRSAGLARWVVRAGAVLAAALIVACGAAARLPPEDGVVRTEVGGQPSLARVALRNLDALLDVDGDGATHVFGGDDCAPWDAARAPGRLEVPDNGVDEDCSGQDLKLDAASFHTGVSHHGRPSVLPGPPHVILITTDALSFAHTGLGGYARDVTPNLDAWASRATVFEHAFAPGPSTENSFPAMFTGVPAPLVRGLWPVASQPPGGGATKPTLAERMRAAGYRTAAVVGSEIFFPDVWPGIAAGFDEFHTHAVAQAKRREPKPKPHASPEVSAVARHVLETRGDQPLFLWVHYFDHHPIYVVPKGESAFDGGAEAVDAYDAELRFADRHWGELLSFIEGELAPEEYVVIFTSDHGEAIGRDAHAKAAHDHCLRLPEVSVPFIVQTARGRGERRKGLVSLLDLVPTVVDLAGAEPSDELRGESLVPALFDGREPEKNVLLTLRYSAQDAALEGGPLLRQVGVRTPELFYLDDRANGVRGLYDWKNDPLEQTDRSEEHPEEVERARYLIAKELADWARRGDMADVVR